MLLSSSVERPDWKKTTTKGIEDCLEPIEKELCKRYEVHVIPHSVIPLSNTHKTIADILEYMHCDIRYTYKSITMQMLDQKRNKRTALYVPVQNNYSHLKLL